MATIEFAPPFSAVAAGIALTALALLLLALRAVWGPTSRLAHRWGIRLLRGAMMLTLLLLLAGPVSVHESPGAVQRPDLFYLLDGSASMAVGDSPSRWDSAQAAMTEAQSLVAPDRLISVRPYVFGHRVSAITPESSVAPVESDTRLAEALQQLAGRFGRRLPAGIVLFSDGRARDSNAVERVAHQYARMNVPIHVYPVGDLGSGGDVAIVSVVAPKMVRKYSDVDVRVFLRSFGYNGQRTQVELIAEADAIRPAETMASVPITLEGGAQSVTLSYRSDDRPRKFTVRIAAQAAELTTHNNSAPALVQIDRSKIRVLYVEGSEEPLRPVSRGSTIEVAGPHSAIADSLTMDLDIECVSLVPYNGSLVRVDSIYGNAGVRGFPNTAAELSAFDGVILSSVASSALTEEQIQWLADLVEHRGGGLCMLGGPNSFTAGGWDTTPLAQVLPITLDGDQYVVDAEIATSLTPIGRDHPVWTIVTDRIANARIQSELPTITGVHRGWLPKPLAEVLATTGSLGDSEQPILVAGSYGRGRSIAAAFPGTSPAADKFLNEWSSSGNQYSSKYWRNLVYWITQNSSIARRRLVGQVDKRFYRLSDTLLLDAVAYDESARLTTNYEVWAMVEPQSLDFSDDSLYAPLRWPEGVPRESGETHPLVAWGEEIPLTGIPEEGHYRLPLRLADRLTGGAANEGLRIELTAYEKLGGLGGFGRGIQVDSTSIDVQILDDPFEYQNPFPNHDLLRRIASLSGGKTLENPGQLADILESLPTEVGPAVVSRVPLWNQWWLLAVFVGLLTTEWLWRRVLGLA